MEINFTADIDVAGLAQDVADLIEASDVAEHVDVHALSQYMDYGQIAEYFETDDIANSIADGFSTRDIARAIDMEDLSEHIEVDFEEIASRMDVQSVADMIDLTELSGYVMRATGERTPFAKITELEERIEKLTKQLTRITDAMVDFGASAMHMDEDEDALSFPNPDEPVISDDEIAVANAKSGYATPTWNVTEVPYI
jgi:hypothetical protein